MFVEDFYTNVLNEAKQSFIFGSISAAVSKILSNRDKNNLLSGNTLYNYYASIKEGIGFTQYNILYTATKYLLGFYELKDEITNGLSLFVASYLIGMRNGRNYAVKNGLMAVVFSYWQRYFNWDTIYNCVKNINLEEMKK